ncbi:MAG TPA: hypothetical protein VFK82_09800 [Burkholderiaceae bacterium]|nr:hypothetical protein [Burkholderiaceae bacterium]
MNLSFKEKSLWLMLISLLVAFGLYFGKTLPEHFALAHSEQPERALWMTLAHANRFALAVIVLVALSVVGHTLIALLDRRTTTDERDRLISLLGARNGGFVLATGVFFALVAAVHTHGNFIFAHVLMLGWVAAELVNIGTQLWLHRRGVM